ncbi:MAG: DoxX family protein [Polyangiaceae bacterium]|nr:DoxX family protein [Polyangiaceae bacterium]
MAIAKNPPVYGTWERQHTGVAAESSVSARTWAAPIGRALISGIFIASGIGKLAGWGETAAFMNAQGIVAVQLFLPLAILVELGCGLALLAGFKARWAAMGLFLFLIPTTYIFHDFWTFAGPERQAQMAQFMKNLAIMGGLLLVVAFGAGRASIDERSHS